MKRSRLDDFWRLSASTRHLPRETREYVPMILAAIVIARNPAQYGFTVASDGKLEYEKVTLPGPVDLRRVAEWTGTSIVTIQSLNPELRRWTTPVRSSGYELKVPEGTAPALQSRLEESAPTDRATLNWYTVRRGESLVTIARKLRVSRTDLAQANYLSPRATVKSGTKLIIPRAPAVLMAAQPDRPVPVAESRPVTEGSNLVAAAPVSEQSNQARFIYKVKRGDTLSSIARVFKTSVASLRLWNHLAHSRINPGDRLTIFTSRTRTASAR
jgi:membrane-bound lytic murein transglycosylase D